MKELILEGGWVMYPLLICSVVSLAVIIERSYFWLMIKIRFDEKLLNEVLELCRMGNWMAVKQKVAGSKNYLIRIMVSGILHRDFSMVKAMESAAAEEVGQMKRFMGVLETMITVAPLFGIFGTVIGIIFSFEALGKAGIDDPASVTSGISQALITTASGLGIAITVVFPFNFFNSRIEKAVATIEKYATSLEIVYEKLNPTLTGEAGGES